MKPSTRLWHELSEAASAWARPINLKEALSVTSTIGGVFVLTNQWATSVQLGAQAAVMKAEVRGVESAMKADSAGVKADVAVLKADLASVKATLDEVLRRLPSPPNR